MTAESWTTGEADAYRAGLRKALEIVRSANISMPVLYGLTPPSIARAGGGEDFRRVVTEKLEEELNK